MQLLRQLVVIAFAMNLSEGTAALFANANAATTCTVTLPNGSSPPGVGSDHQWYGNDKLRVGLYWPNGTVVFRPGGPGFVLRNGSLAMKFGWWRGVNGKLSINGKRLDAPAPPLQAWIPEGYSDSGFEATEIIFPTPGCWQVTGTVGQSSLSFVTRVVQIGSRKSDSWR